MDVSLFKLLLIAGLLGWVRSLIDRPSGEHIAEVGSSMGGNGMVCLLLALGIAVLSIGGLIGMFFDRELFRWCFAVGVMGMVSGTWVLPVACKKPRRDLFFGEVFRLVDGAILVLAFGFPAR